MAPNGMDPGPSSTCGISASPDEQDRLAQILDEYLQGVEQGQPVSPEELLARHPDLAGRLSGYLSGLRLFHDAVANAPQPLSLVGSRADGQELRGELGDFRLLREIGRGGMGVVYEGLQLSLGRRVAIKVLPFAAAVNEKRIMRFKNEAQAAAQVDHPHIVPVYAVGEAHGVHYFAMQYIAGQSLAEVLQGLRCETAGEVSPAEVVELKVAVAHSHEHALTVARMGVQAAQALHAAHEVGIVHRDVKPSNLLLDEKGKLWVTDFGVARCTAGDGLTETGRALGTIRYMSPEQAQGSSPLIDHRSDIYSLGVTLYELATLRHPFEHLSDVAMSLEFGRSGWRRPRHWNPALPVDLENIILKAMSDAREERYTSALAMADDLQRFLDGKPILARPPTLGSRAGKWARRHKRTVTAAGGVLAIALIGVLASLIVIAAERSEKDKAYRTAKANHERAERNLAQAQTRFHQAREMLDRFGPRVAERLADLPGAEGVRKDLLSEMLPYYREFARESSADPSLDADLALTYSKMGYLSEQLGSQVEAEEAYRDALAIFEGLTQSPAARPEHWRSLALCCNNLGQLMQKRGETEKARDHLERALAIQTRLVRAADVVAYRTDLATTHSNVGLLSSQTGDKRQAAERYKSAIEIQESIRRLSPEDATNLNNLAASYNNLSSLDMASQPDAARTWIEKAVGLQLQLVREHPLTREYQRDLALSFSNLGAVHSRLSRWSDAERCFGDAITIQQRLVAAAPLVAGYRSDLAVSLNNLGMAQSSAGNLSEAGASFEKALSIHQDLVAAHPQDVRLLSALGGIFNNLGMVKQSSNELDQAREAFEQAIRAQRQAHERAPEVAYFREALSKHYYNYAAVLRSLNRPVDAAEAVIARRALWPDNPQRLYRAAEDLATICKEIEPGEIRQKFVNEAKRALQAAKAAGLKESPDLQASPFDVLSSIPDGRREVKQ